MTLLFHIYVPQIHVYTIPLGTVIIYIGITTTRIPCTQLFHFLIILLHRFTCIHTLIISVFLLHGSVFLLHEYSYIRVT